MVCVVCVCVSDVVCPVRFQFFNACCASGAWQLVASRVLRLVGWYVGASVPVTRRRSAWCCVFVCGVVVSELLISYGTVSTTFAES